MRLLQMILSASFVIGIKSQSRNLTSLCTWNSGYYVVPDPPPRPGLCLTSSGYCKLVMESIYDFGKITGPNWNRTNDTLFDIQVNDDDTNCARIEAVQCAGDDAEHTLDCEFGLADNIFIYVESIYDTYKNSWKARIAGGKNYTLGMSLLKSLLELKESRKCQYKKCKLLVDSNGETTTVHPNCFPPILEDKQRPNPFYLNPSSISPNECGFDKISMPSRYEGCFKRAPLNDIKNEKIEFEMIRIESKMRWDGFPNMNTASPGQFPWSALMRQPKMCSGVIVHERFILFPSQCLEETQIGKIGIWVGVDPPSTDKMIAVVVENVLLHCCYDRKGAELPSECIQLSLTSDQFAVGLVQVASLIKDNWPKNSLGFYRFNSICLSDSSWHLDQAEIYGNTHWLLSTGPNYKYKLQGLQSIILERHFQEEPIFHFYHKNGLTCDYDFGSGYVVQSYDGRFFLAAISYRNPSRDDCSNVSVAININHPNLLSWIIGVIKNN